MPAEAWALLPVLVRSMGIPRFFYSAGCWPHDVETVGKGLALELSFGTPRMVLVLSEKELLLMLDRSAGGLCRRARPDRVGVGVGIRKAVGQTCAGGNMDRTSPSLRQ